MWFYPPLQFHVVSNHNITLVCLGPISDIMIKNLLKIKLIMMIWVRFNSNEIMTSD